MVNRMIDIMDVKKAVRDGELKAFIAKGFEKQSIMLADNQTGECVKIGEVSEND